MLMVLTFPIHAFLYHTTGESCLLYWVQLKVLNLLDLPGFRHVLNIPIGLF